MNAINDHAIRLARQLADPDTVTGLGHPHSLADGAAGISVLYSTLATFDSQWRPAAFAWLKRSLDHPVAIGPGDGLFHGAPALAYAINLAASHNPDYLNLLSDLEGPLDRITCGKLKAAHERIRSGRLCSFHEYDLISGLTGIAALLLAIQPRSNMLREALSYLVALTRPVPHGRREWPGWWVGHAPNPAHTHLSGGHGNLGIAHGITGPLSVLALAWRSGIRVVGHREAMTAILSWLDTWRHATDGLWWPPVVTADQQLHPGTARFTPERASWCYGAPGIARALHHAARALNDTTLRATAESAILSSLNREAINPQLAEAGLCHGTYGLTATAHAIAHQAPPDVRNAITIALSGNKLPADNSREPGLLSGAAGVAFATLITGTSHNGRSLWCRFLLLE